MRSIDYIWNINEQKLSRWKRWRLRTTKRVVISWECIVRNNLMSYASALTYNTMLAAVPVLAIIFAIARGFGFDFFIEERLRESLEVSPLIADQVMDFVNSYLRHTRGGVFLGVGLIFLLYSLITLTSNIETVFNTIWRVPTSRNVYRKIIDYIGVFLILPFAIVILSGFNIFLISFKSILPEYQFVSDTMEHILQLSPMFFVSVAFILLYKLMPNTRVKFRHTLWPGILAGVLFMAVEYLYIHYQIKLSSYNAIYGSFAALPLFMLWLQISWSICLIGGQLCYTNQNLEHYAFERLSDDLNRRYRDTISLLLMCKICKKFAAGLTPYNERTLSRDTQLPETVVRILLDELVKMQLLVKMHNEAGTSVRYLPAIDIHRMTINMVMRRIDQYGSEVPSPTWHPHAPEWDTLRHFRYHNEGDILLTEI